ncbi:lysophospholipase [Malassezia vespertilionis]|uniref:Lysophospholipase n=1 Tax=Malassezia vespertilionis TaxID=2020962 RepID=A0A2N1JDF3_9BASI|nr:lysophospholipase [Malassezia vespertilionis]PKI84563.1 Plb1p [Malassezia vespertilionis]WFD06338.1 lysophospholipase [Malassezia vespertilionis]
MKWFACTAFAVCLLAGGHVGAYSFNESGSLMLSDAEMKAMLSGHDAEELRKAMHEAGQQFLQDKQTMRRRSSPTGKYSPGHVQCPEQPKGNNYVGFIRNSSDHTMSPDEAGYMNKHKQQIRGAWADWLTRANITGAGGLPGSIDDFLNKNQPSVAFAISGGGYRAMLDGLAMVQGFDGRNETAKQRGVGGLLQATDYVAGLSGGSWATGALAINNWATPQSMVDKFMDLKNNLIFPSDNLVSFYLDLFHDVDDKKDAGFETAIVDLWGRALSYHLLNDTMYEKHGQATTMSDITRTQNFKDAMYPFPIALTIGRQPGETWVNRNATYFEWNPFEFGSWKHGVNAFFPTSYVGTPMNNGMPAADDKHCINGFDNFGFVVGSSSTLFNAAYLKLLQDNSSSVLKGVLNSFFHDLDKELNDVASVPNPFTGYRKNENPFQVVGDVYLVDGGEANQNIPLEPLLQPARPIDMIVAMDGSADTGSSWPNGSALVETRKRMQLKEFSNIAYPNVPDVDTIVNEGLNTRPTFFGCDGSNDIINKDTAVNPLPPLIVYLASYPYSAYANTSTFQLGYNPTDQQNMLDNGFNVATMGGQMDDWHECLACASILRPLQRSKQPIPQNCQQCLQKYCWDGKKNNTKPGNFTPAVGDLPFIQSNGKDTVEPAVTGSNESSSGGALSDMLGDGKGNTTENAADALRFNICLTAALVVSATLYVASQTMSF